jgi:Fe2+ transport system protein FeoA
MDTFRIKGPIGKVCGVDHYGRILKYDQKGRSLRLLSFSQPHGVRQVNVLSELKVGESGVLAALDLPEAVQNHLMHMGFVPGALVTSLRKAPAGDPTVYGVDGMEIALRHETAEAIRVTPPIPEIVKSPDAAGVDELVEAAQ